MGNMKSVYPKPINKSCVCVLGVGGGACGGYNKQMGIVISKGPLWYIQTVISASGQSDQGVYCCNSYINKSKWT